MLIKRPPEQTSLHGIGTLSDRARRVSLWMELHKSGAATENTPSQCPSATLC